MTIFDSMNPGKLVLMAGIGLIGLGIAVAKKVMEYEEEPDERFGSDYDSSFFNAFAKGFEETKDLDW